MISATPPPNEAERLRELRRLNILDTPPEEMFDELTRLIAEVCDVPMAVVSLVDENRQWFKSRVGMSATETAREIAFCAHAIHGRELFVIEDATKDERFHDNPLVTGPPHIRFYAGMPITMQNQQTIGVLCALDHKPRQLTTLQRRVLEVAARQTMRLMEMRHLMILQENSSVFQNLMLTHMASGIIATNPKGIITHINPAAEQMLQYKSGEVVGKTTPLIFHDHAEMAARARELSEELGRPIEPGGVDVFIAKLAYGQEETRSWTYRRKDGSTFPVLLSISPMNADDGALIGYLAVARDITEQKRVENKLRENQEELTRALGKISRQQAMLMDLRQVQGEFINKQDASDAFDRLLALVLKYTESEYGFIGEVLRDEKGQPYLKSLALTNIAWDEATRKFYDEHAPKGMEFRNLKTLFGEVMTSQNVVIANHAPADPRRGGLPHGHPPLHAFLGIPIHLGEKLVGMIGAANRASGYTEDLVAELEPLIASYGNLIQARRNRKLREEAEASLRDNEARLQRVIEAGGLGYWEMNLIDGNFVFSGAWATMLGYDPAELPQEFQTWLNLLHPDDRQKAPAYFNDYIEGRASHYVTEFRMKTKQGDWRWIASECRVVKRTADGRPAVVTGIHKDIHYRKMVEEQARQLKENNTLIQEVHHRVKNNLQVVASLLSFQENQLADLPQAAEKFRVTRGRVGAIASLHEFLYRSSYPDEIPLPALVHDILTQSIAVFGLEPGRIQFNTECQETMIDKSQIGPVVLIINELITNAIKHAFPEQRPGRVDITAGKDKTTGSFVVMIADDGIGMPHLLSRETDSLGVTLVQRLADQLMGTIERINIPQGTCWRLEFPSHKK